MTLQEITDRLFEMQDEKYRDFNSALIPNVNKDTVIGVRTPLLRKLANEIYKQGNADVILSVLPHKYYEENNLHGFLIEKITDYKTCIDELERFLPYVDNWATCDLMSPKVFKKNKDKLILKIREWILFGSTYSVRFAIGMLMSHYLEEDFKIEYCNMVASVQSEEYYVNMMRAWYFATALAKQYDAVLPYLEEKKLDKWTHNKTIQKSVESFRISDENKYYLKTLKIK